MAKNDLTAQRVRELLNYDPQTGALTWRHTTRRTKSGRLAGHYRKDKYHVIGVEGFSYLGHRIAWLHHYGEWPSQFVDHIDGNPCNNAIANLRNCSQQTNVQNHHFRRKNMTGHPGVKEVGPGRFGARVKVGPITINMLGFSSEQEANEMYVRVKSAVHTECAPQSISHGYTPPP